MSKYNDSPLEELAESANPLIAQGAIVYQKWTCEACGERATSNEPNVFCRSMAHEECPVDPGHVTQTPKGNYVLIMPSSPEGAEAIRRLGMG